MLATAATCLSLAAASVGCGDDSASDSSKQENKPAVTTQTSSSEKGAPPKGVKGAPSKGVAIKRRDVTVKVIKTRFGRMLSDGRGRALYLFTKETSDTSECYDDCASAWPPFFTKGSPRTGKGAKAGLIATTKRRDGKSQVTYNGHPLYYYVDDRKPGQVLCQAVEEFGGIWYVVAPRGEAITKS